MKLESFEYSFPNRVLSRAKDHMLTGGVSLSLVSPDNYKASIDEYSDIPVKMTVRGGEVVTYSCACTDGPFPRCIHSAAALYRLRSAIEKGENIELIKSYEGIERGEYAEFSRDFLEFALDRPELYAEAYKIAGGGYVRITEEKREGEGNKREVAAFIEPYLAEREESTGVVFGENNMPVSYFCSCERDRKRGKLCKHAAALICKLYPVETEPDIRTDKVLVSLMRRAESEKIVPSSGESGTLILEPYIDGTEGELLLGFRIGRERMYVVSNLVDFISTVREKGTLSIGKSFEETLSPERFDERSISYIRFIAANKKTIGDESLPKDKNKLMRLTAQESDRIFELSSGGFMWIGAEKYPVERRTPPISVKMVQGGKNGFAVRIEESYRWIGEGEYCYILSGDMIFVTDHLFKSRAGALSRALIRAGKQGLALSKYDANAFYTSLIIPAKRYINFEASDPEALKALPSPLEPRLFIDTDGKRLTAVLTFVYGELKRRGFLERDRYGAPDPDGEAAAEGEVRRWFSTVDLSLGICYSEDSRADFMRVINEGIPSLSEKMTVELSQAVEQRSVKRDFDVSLSVDVSGGLLDLKIDSSYSPAELAAILTDYKKGTRYHVFSDGSYLDLESESFSRFAGISEELAIGDKGVVRKSMQLPFYRILYLNLLSKQDKIRVDCKEGFRAIIEDFESGRGLDFEPPAELSAIMRNYQREGFLWLSTLEKYGFGGILADDMGLGKTVQTIALIKAYTERTKEGERRPALVVCPSSLVYNWMSEIERFAPELTRTAAVGSATKRCAVMTEEGDRDVIVTSYDAVKRDVDLYRDMRFSFVIADEAQYIKNRATQASKALKAIEGDMRIALTGTPVENRPSDLWSIFEFIMPGYLRSYNKFKSTYETPILKDSSEEALARLKMLTSPFILRRMKTDVLKELPEKTETVLCTSFDEEQKKAYTAHAAMLVSKIRAEIEENGGIGAGGDKITVLSMLMRIRQICCHPPLALGADYKGESAKLALCLDLVRSSTESGHQILLFSQFTSMLDVIAAELDKAGISYLMLTGKTPQRERPLITERFGRGEASVFLISLKAGGTGLNLTSADIVIHYDPWWNLAVQNQATDRAYRIGQDKSVQVYKLIIKDSIEEKIIELQKKKSGIAEILSGEEENAITGMRAEEILMLFENLDI